MTRAIIIDLAQYRADRDRQRQAQVDLVLWSPPFVWWTWTMSVWRMMGGWGWTT